MLGKKKKELSYSASHAGCWKDDTEINEKVPWNIMQRDCLHGATLSDQKPPALSEQPCIGGGEWSVHQHHHLQGTCSDIQLPSWGWLVSFCTTQDIPLNFQLAISGLLNYPTYSHQTGRYDIGPVGKLCPPGGAAGRQVGCLRQQNYIRCLCLDIWAKQGEISGPINLVLALTGSVSTFPTRHSLKVAKHGGIRKEQSSELKNMLYIQAVPCRNCLVIVVLGRRRTNCTGI